MKQIYTTQNLTLVEGERDTDSYNRIILTRNGEKWEQSPTIENYGYIKDETKLNYYSSQSNYNCFNFLIDFEWKENIYFETGFSLNNQKYKYEGNIQYRSNAKKVTIDIIGLNDANTINNFYFKAYEKTAIEAIFTTTTTAVTEFAESVSTSVSAVGGMFYQNGQMTFLGTLSLLTAGTLLVMWAVRTIRRLIGR